MFTAWIFSDIMISWRNSTATVYTRGIMEASSLYITARCGSLQLKFQGLYTRTMSIIIRVKPLIRLNIRHKNTGRYTMWHIVSPIWPSGYGTCVRIMNGSFNGAQGVCPLGYNHTIIKHPSLTYRLQSAFEYEVILLFCLWHVFC
jgi:hypothetical protein